MSATSQYPTTYDNQVEALKKIVNNTGILVDAGGLGEVLSVTGANSLSASPTTGNVIVKLVGDVTSPGNNYFYGTNGSGTKGFYALSSYGVTSIAGTANEISATASTGSVTLSLTGPHGFSSMAVNNIVVGNSGSTTGALTASGATITSSGNVLTFAGGSTWTDNASGSITINAPSSQTFIIQSGGARALTLTSGQNALFSGSISAYSGTLSLYSSNNYAAITLTNAGIVNLYSGTTTLALSLNASQLATFAGNITVSGNTITYGGGSTIVDNGSGAITVTAGGSNTNITLTPNGTGSVLVSSGSQANPGLAGTSYAATGLYWSSGPQLNISANNAQVAAFSSALVTFPVATKCTSSFTATSQSLFGNGAAIQPGTATFTDNSGLTRVNLKTAITSGYGVELWLDSTSITSGRTYVITSTGSSEPGGAGQLQFVDSTASVTPIAISGGAVGSGVISHAYSLDASGTTASATFAGGIYVAKTILCGSKITTLGGATFHTTSTALTNGAGSSAGTLTNAPSVGNPTKWIGINDNGTTRYIPAW